MKRKRVFIIGDTVFAEALGGLLTSTGEVAVLGSAPTPESALAQLAEQQPDVLIEAGASAFSMVELGRLLTALPNSPVIRADLETEAIQVINTRLIGTRLPDLLDALSGLAARQPSQNLDPSPRRRGRPRKRRV